MGFKELFQRVGNRKEKFREAEDDVRISQGIQQKQKSANERELERFDNEKREVNIKKRLDAFRKERNQELFRNDLFKQENIFKGKSTVLNNDFNVMKGDGTFMKKGNMLFS